MLNRRHFLAWTGAGTLTLFATSVAGPPVALAEAVPGGTLDPATIPKFETPLLVPPVMPRSGTLKRKGGKNADTYDISVRQLTQQVLPEGLPQTTVWGYGPTNAPRRGAAFHHAPSFTIEAQYNRPVRVTWRNELVDADRNYLPHLLPVDPTLHWANPEQRPGADGIRTTDIKPDFSGLTYVPPDQFTDPSTQYTAYDGPVPIVTHVHGAMRVGDESDGYSEAWFLPMAKDIPEGYATKGRWYDFFAAKFKRVWGGDWGEGFSISEYPNLNRASTMWYHDHTLGMTRLNVYAGPAGFYVLRGGPDGDKAVLDATTGRPAILPGPAPREGDRGNKNYKEIPLAIQDRSFNTDGSLFYPDTRAFFDGFEGPYIGAGSDSEVPPIWNPEFFGNTIIVNGNTWPSLTVEQVRYRFRVLNGCQGRFLILDFTGIPGIQVTVIGNDGGFLPAPHDVMAAGGTIVVAPAQRLDVIVDFANVPVGRHVLRNNGPDAPYGGGGPDPENLADPDTTGQVMAFQVVPAMAPDPTTAAANLVLPAIAPQPAQARVRRLALMEHAHTYGEGGPVAAMLGVLHGNPVEGTGMAHHTMWMDLVTENPMPGDTEVWEIYNLTVDAHPIHVHETAFEVVDRQAIAVDDMGMISLVPDTNAPPWPPETGLLDTITAEPEQVTRLRMTFGTAGQYVWHCHLVEHEDNEMMRPYRIGPVQSGQPDEAAENAGPPMHQPM